jgi:poly-beta-1,6-N-acetyl-D-glucosamine synthase
MDYSLGSHPLFEIVKLSRRWLAHPRLVGAFVMFCAFTFAYFRREERMVSDDFVRFLRREQIDRLRPFGSRRLSNRRRSNVTPSNC